MRKAIKSSHNAETMYVKKHVKSYAKQEFQKICFFTYSFCGFDNIIVTDVVKNFSVVKEA